MDDSDSDTDGPQVLLERMFEAKKRWMTRMDDSDGLLGWMTRMHDSDG